MKQKIILNKWEYEVIHSGEEYSFSINPENKSEKPDSLYKIYALNEYNIEALKNNHIYASHPRDLNDPFDCYNNLVSFDKLSLEEVKSFIGDDPQIFKESIESLYIHNKPKLIAAVQTVFWEVIYSKLGIFSMSEIANNIQMWAYYCNQKGFQLKFNTSLFQNHFRGPFQVNYITNPEVIYPNGDLFLSLLYQTNIKDLNWSHEKEWRYLVTGKTNMTIPDPILQLKQKEQQSRLFKYPLEAIQEVALGYYFFKNEEFVTAINLYDVLYKIDNENDYLKIELLNYLVSHPEIETRICDINIAPVFEMKLEKIIIKKEDDNSFWIKKVIN